MSKQVHFFLGANSAEGFCSFYEELFHDPQIHKVWIIKGGSGNGKSTFMRAMGNLADKKGLAQEYALCSSDPDSLDAVIFRDIGLAIVDGTAPHIVEPQLCGLDSVYLNFSSCYRSGMEKAREEIIDAQQKNKAAYPPAYSCLSAAGSLMQQIEQLAGQPDAIGALAQGIMQAEFCKDGSNGSTIRRFISGITPKGLQYRMESFNVLCDRLYAFNDTFGLSHSLLQMLHAAAVKKGYACITGHSPLRPDHLEQLLIPELRLGFLRTSQQLSYHGSTYCQTDLDALVNDHLSESDKKHIPFFVCTAKALVQEAITYLQEAKVQHDRLELACRPYVDFTAVSALREQYGQKLNAMMQ